MEKVLIQLVKKPNVTRLVSQRDANILIKLGRARLPATAVANATPKPAVILDEYDAMSYNDLRGLVKERELDPPSARKEDLLAALRAPYTNRAMTSE